MTSSDGRNEWTSRVQHLTGGVEIEYRRKKTSKVYYIQLMKQKEDLELYDYNCKYMIVKNCIYNLVFRSYLIRLLEG